MTTSELSIDRTYPKRRILLVVALVALGFALRDHLLAAILFALSNLWQMTPIVLAGLLVTAVLTATGSIGLLVATFDARETLAIVMVSLIGAVLPVCGITLLPLVAGLLGAGMPLAPVMAPFGCDRPDYRGHVAACVHRMVVTPLAVKMIVAIKGKHTTSFGDEVERHRSSPVIL